MSAEFAICSESTKSVQRQILEKVLMRRKLWISIALSIVLGAVITQGLPEDYSERPTLPIGKLSSPTQSEPGQYCDSEDSPTLPISDMSCLKPRGFGRYCDRAENVRIKLVDEGGDGVSSVIALEFPTHDVL